MENPGLEKNRIEHGRDPFTELESLIYSEERIKELIEEGKRIGQKVGSRKRLEDGIKKLREVIAGLEGRQ